MALSAIVSLFMIVTGSQTFALRATDNSSGVSISESDQALRVCPEDYDSSNRASLYPCNNVAPVDRPPYELYAAITIFVLVLIAVVALVRIKKRKKL